MKLQEKLDGELSIISKHQSVLLAAGSELYMSSSPLTI